DDYYGTAFDDSVKGLGGDDRFDGGPGIDTAIYTGPRSQYQIIDRGDHIEVRGPEGTDTLYSVEKLQFADTTVSIGSPPATTPTPPRQSRTATPPRRAQHESRRPDQPPPPYVPDLCATCCSRPHTTRASAPKVSRFDRFNF